MILLGSKLLYWPFSTVICTNELSCRGNTADIKQKAPRISHWQEQILVPKHGEGIKLSLPLLVSTGRRMVKIPAQSKRGFNFLFPLAMEMLLVIQNSGKKKR